MRKEFGLLPGGVERFEQALLASPQVDLVTNAMRRQNHSVCRFRLPQIETSTRSALIKRQPMTSSSPRGPASLLSSKPDTVSSAPTFLREASEKVFYYRSDKRGLCSAAA